MPVSSMARYGFFSESIIVLCRMPLKKNSSVNAAVSIIRQKNTGSFTNMWRIFVILKQNPPKPKTRIITPWYATQIHSILNTVFLSKCFKPDSFRVCITFSFLKTAIIRRGKRTRNNQFDNSLINPAFAARETLSSAFP